MIKLRSQIIGCGSYLPDQVVSNDDLAKSVDTSHEWIVERTGIERRHFARDGQLTSDLATAAAKQALENAGVKPSEIDLIIVATATPDDTFPSTATTVQAKLDCHQGFAFDVAAVCSGYLVALSIANNYLQTGQAKTALVIGAETLSRILDMEDRRTCVLFGDGAGAVVLRAQETSEDQGVLGVYLQSDGKYRNLLYTSGGPSSSGSAGFIRMEGREVFRHAISKLAESAVETLKKHQFELKDVDWFIPHQANLRIINGIAQKLNFPLEKVITTVNHHANTSAASIPLALTQAINDGRVKRGDLILHEAIGGGMIWGSALVRY